MQKPPLWAMLAVVSLLGGAGFADAAGKRFFWQTSPAIADRRTASPTPTNAHSPALPPIALPAGPAADRSGPIEPSIEPPIKPFEQLCADASDAASGAYRKLPLRQVAPVFRPCAAELLKRTQVPVVLPPLIPKKFPKRYGDGGPLYAYFSIAETNAGQYYVGLTRASIEFYQMSRAYFTGEKLTSQSPTLAAYYEKESEWGRSVSASRAAELGQPVSFFEQQGPPLVRLSRGLQGYFIPGVCGANCHGAYDSVTWDDQGYRYRVAIKMSGNRAEVVELANAAIENQK